LSARSVDRTRLSLDTITILLGKNIKRKRKCAALSKKPAAGFHI